MVDGVYPRTHGETYEWVVRVDGRWGLSPYTRGNLPLVSGIPLGLGSIPVHTGKPSWIDDTPILWGVYPRTHGETFRIGFNIPLC